MHSCKGKKKRAENEAEAVTKLTVPQTSPLPKTGGGEEAGFLRLVCAFWFSWTYIFTSSHNILNPKCIIGIFYLGFN